MMTDYAEDDLEYPDEEETLDFDGDDEESS